MRVVLEFQLPQLERAAESRAAQVAAPGLFGLGGVGNRIKPGQRRLDVGPARQRGRKLGQRAKGAPGQNADGDDRPHREIAGKHQVGPGDNGQHIGCLLHALRPIGQHRRQVPLFRGFDGRKRHQLLPQPLYPVFAALGGQGFLLIHGLVQQAGGAHRGALGFMRQCDHLLLQQKTGRNHQHAADHQNPDEVAADRGDEQQENQDEGNIGDGADGRGGEKLAHGTELAHRAENPAGLALAGGGFHTQKALHQARL